MKGKGSKLPLAQTVSVSFPSLKLYLWGTTSQEKFCLVHGFRGLSLVMWPISEVRQSICCKCVVKECHYLIGTRNQGNKASRFQISYQGHGLKTCLRYMYLIFYPFPVVHQLATKTLTWSTWWQVKKQKKIKLHTFKLHGLGECCSITQVSQLSDYSPQGSVRMHTHTHIKHW